MLIELDGDFLAPNQYTQEELAAIEEVLCSSFFGHHLVIANRRILVRLLELEIGTRSKAAIRRIINRYAYLGSIKNSIPVSIRISRLANECRKVETTYSVPLKAFSRIRLSQYLFHAENITDTQFYRFAIIHAIFANKCLYGVKFSFKGKGCGGSQIADETRAAVESNELVVSITDSDRICPSSNSSASTRNCQALQPEFPFAYTHIELYGRDSENCLPIALLKEFSESESSILFDIYEQDKALWNKCKRFGDIKEGIRISDICTNEKYSSQFPKEFWMSIARSLCSRGNFDFCQSPHSQECIKPDCICQCLIFPRSHKSILEKVIEKIEKMSVKKSYEYFVHENEWIELGTTLLHKFVSDERLRLS